MPLIHVIPYVADLFDPGLYVFDGGTFRAGDVAQSQGGDRAFYTLDAQTFNLSETLTDQGNRAFFAFAGQQISAEFRDHVPIFIHGQTLDIAPVTETNNFNSHSPIELDISPVVVSNQSTLVSEEAEINPGVSLRINAGTLPIDSQYVLSPSTQDFLVAGGEHNTIREVLPVIDADGVGVAVENDKPFDVIPAQDLDPALTNPTASVTDQDIMIASPRGTINADQTQAMDAVSSLAMGSDTDRESLSTLTLSM
jgi:hypothetical protein